MLNPSRSCCCNSPSCGAQYGQIRPFGQTSGFTYEITDFQNDYGPPSVLGNIKLLSLDIIETETALQRESGFTDANCCQGSYLYDVPPPTNQITCYTDNLTQYSKVEGPQMAVHLNFTAQRLACPEPIENLFTSITVIWRCNQGPDDLFVCNGPRCSMPLECPYPGNQEDPADRTPTKWTGKRLDDVRKDSTTVDPMTIGKAKLVATRSSGFLGFSTAIQNSNGNLLQAQYLHRADFSQNNDACEGGGSSVPVETPCQPICACVSTLLILTRMTQTRYLTFYDCNENANLVPSTVNQDVYLFYTGPLDGLLYDATAPNTPSRTFTLQEARIQHASWGSYSLRDVYFCNIPHPYAPIIECNLLVNEVTSELNYEPDQVCEYHCGTMSIPDPVTGVGTLFNIINAAGAKQYGFPATITVLRTST